MNPLCPTPSASQRTARESAGNDTTRATPDAPSESRTPSHRTVHSESGTVRQSATPPITADLVGSIRSIWRQVRESNPLVQCITNTVVQPLSANVLLAAGASPAMVDITGEAGDFAAITAGLLINLGTPHPEQREAMREAAVSAHAAGTPWVLDPVAVGGLRHRTAMAAELLGHKPTLIRGNASEIIALNNVSGGTPTASTGKGTDAGDSVESALGAATELATRVGTVVAVSGPVDLITDGTTILRCSNGHALLTLVTGGGCSLGAYMAAFASTRDNPLLCAAAAHTCYGIAAERAARVSHGPGSFAVHLLDELAALDEDAIAAHARVTEGSDGGRND